jgi:hypothetical protein
MVAQIGGGGERRGGVMITQGISPPVRGMVAASMVVSGNNTVSLTRCHDVLDPFSPLWICGQLHQAAGMLPIGAERLRQRGLQGL